MQLSRRGPQFPHPARFTAFGVNSVNVAVRATEIHNAPVNAPENSRLRPQQLSPTRAFRNFRLLNRPYRRHSRKAHCCRKEREWNGSDRQPGIANLSPSFYIDGMKIPAKRGHVQDPIAQYRRRTNGLSHTNLPSHPGRATFADRALSAASRIVTKQCGPFVLRPERRWDLPKAPSLS